jgi:hypothetical protein
VVLPEVRKLALAPMLLGLAACAPRHRAAIGEYKAKAGRPPATLEGELSILDQSCGENERAKVGLCEDAGARVVWFERRETATSARWAYAGGTLAFYEEHEGRATSIFGTEPSCHPVLEPVCGELERLKKMR